MDGGWEEEKSENPVGNFFQTQGTTITMVELCLYFAKLKVSHFGVKLWWNLSVVVK